MINSTTTALACIYGAAMLVFTGAFLIDWIRLRKKMRIYLEYGVWIGFAIVGLQILAVSITPSALTSLSIFTIVIQSIIMFIRAVGFTMVGMYYCTSLGYPSFPLLLRKFGLSNSTGPVTLSQTSETNPQDASLGSGSFQKVDGRSVEAPIAEDSSPPDTGERPPVILEVNWKKFSASVLTVAAVGALYSIGLFLLTKPSVSVAVQRALGTTPLEEVYAVTLQSTLLVLAVAVGEEVFFRLGIQNYLAGRLRLKDERYWIAIVITTVVWTLAHAGALDPDWVKLAQVFPVGLMFGWLSKKYGVESSMLAHGLFNLLLLFPAPYLIK